MSGILFGSLLLLTSCAYNEKRMPSSDGTWGNSSSDPVPHFVVRNEYLGNGQFEIEFTMKNSNEVVTVTLEDTGNKFCWKNLPKVVLNSENNFSFKKIMKRAELKNNQVCDYKTDYVNFNKVMVLFKDGSMDMLEPIEYYFSSALSGVSDRLAGSGKGGSEWNYNDPSVVTFSSKMISEERGKDKESDLGKPLETKIQTYSISMKVDEKNLAGFSGVVLENGKELLSDNPTELANFINSEKVEVEVMRVQEFKAIRIACANRGKTKCLVKHDSILKDQFKLVGLYNEAIVHVKFLKKEGKEVKGSLEYFIID